MFHLFFILFLLPERLTQENIGMIYAREGFAYVLFQEFYGVGFKSLSHFEFMFVYGVRVCFNLTDLHTPVQFSQHHVLKRPSFLHVSFLPPLLGINSLQLCGFIYCMKSGRVMPPTLLFCLRILLAILGLLWFHIHFRIICCSSVKNVMSNLMGIA